MLDIQIEELARRVREVLESGSFIAIVGWMSSNHNEFTKRLLAEKKVVFFSSESDTPGKRFDLVLLTKYMHHTVSRKIRARKKGMVYPIVLEIGQIRRILESCEDLLIPRCR